MFLVSGNQTKIGRTKFSALLCSVFSMFFYSLGPANSQAAPPPPPTTLAPVQLAQLPSLYPTDVTPVNIGRERDLLKPGFSYYLFQNLPSRLWFNVTAETSQRYESNVFFSRTRYVSDYVYRILPNVTVGYEVAKKVSIYCNYFTIKDVFVGHGQLTFPTTQSLSMGMRREFTIGRRNNLQLDFQARELWQTVGIHQFDFIPGMTLTRFVTPRTIVYANTLLQLRGGDYFVAPTREIDPFYTIGLLHTKGNWMFSAVGTLVTNFRHPPFNFSIPPNSNNSIIADFEVAHPVPKMKHLVAFVRAEPIWNWNGNGEQGISGMDFRLFSGIRMSMAKPAYTSSIKNLKQQLHDVNYTPVEEPNETQPEMEVVPEPGSQSAPSTAPSLIPPMNIEGPKKPAIPLQAVPQELPKPAQPERPIAVPTIQQPKPKAPSQLAPESAPPSVAPTTKPPVAKLQPAAKPVPAQVTPAAKPSVTKQTITTPAAQPPVQQPVSKPAPVQVAPTTKSPVTKPVTAPIITPAAQPPVQQSAPKETIKKHKHKSDSYLPPEPIIESAPENY